MVLLLKEKINENQKAPNISPGPDTSHKKNIYLDSTLRGLNSLSRDKRVWHQAEISKRISILTQPLLFMRKLFYRFFNRRRSKPYFLWTYNGLEFLVTDVGHDESWKMGHWRTHMVTSVQQQFQLNLRAPYFGFKHFALICWCLACLACFAPSWDTKT